MPAIDPQTGGVDFVGWSKGLDNLRMNYELLDDSVRNCMNVDFTVRGKIRRRDGYTLAAALTNGHSAFALPNFMAYVNNGTLTVVNTSLVTVATMTGFSATRRVAFEFVNGDAYFSDGAVNGRISGVDGSITSWGVESPAAQPTLSVVAGSLNAGTYRCVVTFLSSTGEESGTGSASVVTIPDVPPGNTGSIAFSNIPQPAGSGVSTILIYLTEANGSIFRRVASIPVGTTSHILGSSIRGSTLRTQFCDKPPVGSGVLGATSNLLLIGDGQVVWNTQPFRFGLFNNTSDFMMFGGTVTLIWGTPTAAFICADQTYFVTGIGTDQMELRTVLPYGAVKGTRVILPNQKEAMWLSTRGIVHAYIDGSAKNVSEEMVSIPNYVEGAAMIREANGLRQYVVSAYSPVAGSSYASSDYTASETVRLTEVY